MNGHTTIWIGVIWIIKYGDHSHRKSIASQNVHEIPVGSKFKVNTDALVNLCLIKLSIFCFCNLNFEKK